MLKSTEAHVDLRSKFDCSLKNHRAKRTNTPKRNIPIERAVRNNQLANLGTQEIYLIVKLSMDKPESSDESGISEISRSKKTAWTLMVAFKLDCPIDLCFAEDDLLCECRPFEM